MAVVPGVLIVGADSLFGGPSVGPGAIALQADATSTVQTPLMEFRALRPMRILPSGDDDGFTDAAALGWYPWWDPGSDHVIEAWATVSSTSTTVTLLTTGAGFLADELVGRRLRVVNFSGFGVAQRRTITANTATVGGQTTITVGTPWSTNPVLTQLVCCGRGRWIDYHAAAGYVHPNEALLGLFPSGFSVRGGSAESGIAAGVGVGLDAGLMRLLFERVWGTDPYFQVAKVGTNYTTKTNFASGGAAVTAITAELGRMATAWAEQGFTDTLSWRWIIVDNSQKDVVDWASNPGNAATYAADVVAMIAALRTAVGNSEAKILIVNHAEGINAVDAPGGTVFANRAHRAAALTGTDVYVVSLDNVPLQTFESDFWIADENQAFYERNAYWDEIPTRVVDTIRLAEQGSVPDQTGGFPVYVGIGDSIMAGFVDETYSNKVDSPTLISTARGSNQLIWNAITKAGEAYNLGDNSNTSGTIAATGGPEYALLHRLSLRHPDGFLYVKRASVISCLAALRSAYSGDGAAGGRWSSAQASEHYAALLANLDEALQWVNVVKGKQADIRGVFCILGTNDGAVAGGGELFAAELPVFLDALRTDVQTRTSGGSLPVSWVIPQLGVTGGLEDELVEIRAALRARAEVDDAFDAVDVDDLETLAADGLHITMDGNTEIGFRFDASMAALAESDQ